MRIICEIGAWTGIAACAQPATILVLVSDGDGGYECAAYCTEHVDYQGEVTLDECVIVNLPPKVVIPDPLPTPRCPLEVAS